MSRPKRRQACLSSWAKLTPPDQGACLSSCPTLGAESRCFDILLVISYRYTLHINIIYIIYMIILITYIHLLSWSGRGRDQAVRISFRRFVTLTVTVHQLIVTPLTLPLQLEEDKDRNGRLIESS
jgi:hypothetical protein